jgi:hypothetical protein
VFCNKHNVSYDWLLCGDLKGLLRMPAKRERPSALTTTAFVKLYGELPMEQRREISTMVAELLPRKPRNEAPAPIGQKAQSAAVSFACEAAEG